MVITHNPNWKACSITDFIFWILGMLASKPEKLCRIIRALKLFSLNNYWKFVNISSNFSHRKVDIFK